MTKLRTSTASVGTLASMLLLLAGCTAEPAADAPTSDSTTVTEPVTVREALNRAEPGQQVRVKATLVTEDDIPLLCDSVEDSDPEQCGDPQVELVGAPLDELGLTERRSELSGEVDIIISIDGQTATFVGLSTNQ